MWGNHFSVKEDLKPSFIDPAADLKHIHLRRGPDVGVRESNFSDEGTTGRPLEVFQYTGLRRNS
jgi:hypothetical protein